MYIIIMKDPIFGQVRKEKPCFSQSTVIHIFEEKGIRENISVLLHL